MKTDSISPPATTMPAIEMVAVSSLRPREKNARTHSKKQVQMIAKSIKAFGFTNPVLIDADGVLLAGHGRLEAAKSIGLTEIPARRVVHLTPDQVRAYVIADNRIAEKAGWDPEILALELGELSCADFEVDLTGFSAPEIDAMLNPMIADDDDILEPESPDSVVSLSGDTWQLGRHVVHCGDALSDDSYITALGEPGAAMVFTDPPYNVPIAGHVSVTHAKRHGEFVMASGEMSTEQFTTFLSEVFARIAQICRDGALVFVCMDWRHLREITAAGDKHFELKNVCIWNKANAGMGSLYRSKYEMVFVFKRGTAPHVNNVELGKHGRYRSNVWNYEGVTSLGKGRSERLAMHPTVKPVAMISDAIMDCSNRGDTILDPFGGSGSTLIAAEKTGRRAVLIELDPRYVDVIIRRFQRLGMGDAIHAATGKPFSQVATERLGAARG